MKEKFDVQVSNDMYYKEYDSELRFIHYFYQTDIIKKINPKTILEIGVGNKTVTNYLKEHNFNVTTCDFDKKLKPDYVADIRKLPFKENKFDLILACEILEHLPWNEVDVALEQLQKTTKKYVLLSLPYAATTFEFIVKLPLFHKILKRNYLDFFFRIPKFYKKPKFTGEHYWEIGLKGHSIKKVRELMRKRFKIVEEIRPLLTTYHYFFVLEKK